MAMTEYKITDRTAKGRNFIQTSRTSQCVQFNIAATKEVEVLQVTCFKIKKKTS